MALFASAPKPGFEDEQIPELKASLTGLRGVIELPPDPYRIRDSFTLQLRFLEQRLKNGLPFSRQPLPRRDVETALRSARHSRPEPSRRDLSQNRLEYPAAEPGVHGQRSSEIPKVLIQEGR